MRITGEENNILILKELSKRLRDLRISEALTQADLAEKSGVSVKTIERLEKGENPNFFNLLNVMRTLGVLSNLQVMLPEPRVSPEELRERGKKRQRVTEKQKNKDKKQFIWGEDK